MAMENKQLALVSVRGPGIKFQVTDGSNYTSVNLGYHSTKGKLHSNSKLSSRWHEIKANSKQIFETPGRNSSAENFPRSANPRPKFERREFSTICSFFAYSIVGRVKRRASHHKKVLNRRHTCSRTSLKIKDR